MSTALPVIEHVVRHGLEQARAKRPLSIVPDGSALYLRRAEPSDAREIHELLEVFVAHGQLLPRTLRQVYRTIRDYVVAIEDGRIVGCAALRIYSADVAEVGALAVAAEKHGSGIGRRLVETLVHDAGMLGLRRVFALTLQDGFFHRLGFETTVVSEFPEKVAADCSTCARRATCAEIAVARNVTN
ncbi:MAG TPA: N-acetyltransferase [Longimicrobiales bacterium]|nr:N-acetyltransferase [Longimicrobiales bacterium]